MPAKESGITMNTSISAKNCKIQNHEQVDSRKVDTRCHSVYARLFISLLNPLKLLASFFHYVPTDTYSRNQLSYNRRCQSDCGATFVEAAIIIPLVLGIIFISLDFCFIYARQFRLDDAVRSTARKLEGSFEDCEIFVNRVLGEEMAKAGVDHLFQSHSSQVDSTVYPDGTSPFILRVEAQIPCMICKVARLTESGAVEFERSVLVSLEPGVSCAAWSESRVLCEESDTRSACHFE